MKYILLLSLFFGGLAQAQTATTVAKIKATATAPVYSTVYKVVSGSDTIYYKAFAGIAAKPDDATVIQAANGAFYVKLIPAVGVQQVPVVSVPFTADQLQKVNALIDSAMTRNTLFFDNKTMTGDGSAKKPIGILKAN